MMRGRLAYLNDRTAISSDIRDPSALAQGPLEAMHRFQEPEIRGSCRVPRGPAKGAGVTLRKRDGLLKAERSGGS